MSFTNDPIRDYDNYCRKQQKAEERLPVCADCGEPIDSDCYYEFDCYFYCEKCLEDNHRKWTEDYCG
jgi:hypothetical protein